MSPTAIRNGRLLIGVGCAAAAVMAVAALRAEVMVRHGFPELAGSQWTRSVDAPTRVSTDFVPKMGPKVGDEGYWLTRAEVESPLPFAKQLAVGDRITIAGRDGRERTLEVVDVRSLGEPLTKAVAGANPMRLLLITSRVVGASERESDAQVRFIVEGDPPAAPAVQRTASPKAL